MTFAGAESTDFGARAYFRGETDDDVVAIDAEFVVTCDEGDVDPATFRCLNDAGIVFDGDVVVDASFRTNDPDVYAGGDVAKFSRRLDGRRGDDAPRPDGGGTKTRGRHHRAPHGARDADDRADVRGRARGVRDVSGRRAVRESGGGGDESARRRDRAAAGGRAVTSVAGGEFCRLDVDRSDTIVAFSYLGANAVDPRRFARLVGLPASLVELDAFERRRRRGPGRRGKFADATRRAASRRGVSRRVRRDARRAHEDASSRRGRGGFRAPARSEHGGGGGAGDGVGFSRKERERLLGGDVRPASQGGGVGGGGVGGGADARTMTRA